MAPPITKVQCGKWERGRKGRRGDLGLFISQARRMFHCNHSISPEWLISCGVAAQRKRKKAPISTGMFCHLMPYLIAGLCNSVKSGPEAVRLVSSCTFALNPDVTAALQVGITPHIPRMDSVIFLQQQNVNRNHPNCENWTWSCH